MLEQYYTRHPSLTSQVGTDLLARYAGVSERHLAKRRNITIVTKDPLEGRGITLDGELFNPVVITGSISYIDSRNLKAPKVIIQNSKDVVVLNVEQLNLAMESNEFDIFEINQLTDTITDCKQTSDRLFMMIFDFFMD